MILTKFSRSNASRNSLYIICPIVASPRKNPWGPGTIVTLYTRYPIVYRPLGQVRCASKGILHTNCYATDVDL